MKVFAAISYTRDHETEIVGLAESVDLARCLVERHRKEPLSVDEHGCINNYPPDGIPDTVGRAQEFEVTSGDLVATVSDFLEEYSAMCKRYGVTISSCGCCGGPFLRGTFKGSRASIEDVVDEIVEDLRNATVDGDILGAARRASDSQ